MEGDNYVSVVVPPNGVTVSLFTGALVPSTAPSSNSIPRLPICPEAQTVNKVCVHGAGRENHNASASITTRPHGRSRVREPHTRRRRSRSQPKSRSRSRSRSRGHGSNCSPGAGKSRHESKSRKKDRRSCSVTSTCSRSLRWESPNERYPPVRPLSKHRQQRRRELKKSPNRHYSRKFISMATSIDMPIEKHNTVTQEEQNHVSEIDLANARKENRNAAVAHALDEMKWVKFVDNENTVSPRKNAVKLFCGNAKHQNIDENTELTQLPKGMAVNYVTGLQTYVNKLKSFYSDSLDCSGCEACPPLRDRMAHHRLKHHQGHKLDPRADMMDYPAKDAKDLVLRKSNSPTRDHLVQTKVTLGDLGEIVIRLDKSIKISNENDDEESSNARRTLVGNKHMPSNKNRRVVGNDYNKHKQRMSKRGKPDNDIYEIDNTNQGHGMNKSRDNLTLQDIEDENGFNDIQPSKPENDRQDMKSHNKNDEFNRNRRQSKQKRSKDSPTRSTYRDDISGNNVSNDLNDHENDNNNSKFENDDISPFVNDTIHKEIDPLPALSKEVNQWLNFVPLFPDTIDKDTIINDLIEKLNKISNIPIDSEKRDEVLETLISDCLEKLHTWYPGAKRDQAEYKHNLIQSLLQRIKPVFDQTTHDSVVKGHRNKSKKKCNRAYKSNHVRPTISSNVICGDTTVERIKVKSTKPTEKYKSEFAQAIHNWITRYDFLKHDGLQQIHIHDLIGILLSRLSPYLDRPYNSTNKLILKAKVVDIMNSLPICIHHSPYQKTQVIKFAEELANSLLNIQTRFDDDKKYANNLFKPQYQLLHIEEVRKNDILRKEISNEMRQCLQNTPLSNDILVQIRLTDVVLNYLETFHWGYTDATRSAVMKALEKSNLVDKDKTVILDKIIESLYALSEKRMPSIHPESGLSVNKSEMEIRDTVFSLFTQPQARNRTQRTRNKRGSGLNEQEDEHLENLKHVIRDWTQTLPEPFSNLRFIQKEDIISGLAEDVFIQEKIQEITPIPGIERDKFWKFFAYRWFYRTNLFEDLNSAEPYSEDLCNRLNDFLPENTISPSDLHQEDTDLPADRTNKDNLHDSEYRRNKRREDMRKREEDRREEERRMGEENRMRMSEDRQRRQDGRYNSFMKSDEGGANAFEEHESNNVNRQCNFCNKQKLLLWGENPASHQTPEDYYKWTRHNSITPESYNKRTKHHSITAARSEVMKGDENARGAQISPPALVKPIRVSSFIAPALAPKQTVSQPLTAKTDIALSPKSTHILKQPKTQAIKSMNPQNKQQCLSFSIYETPNSNQPKECFTETENQNKQHQNPNEKEMNQAITVNTPNKHEHRQSINKNHKRSPHTPSLDSNDLLQKCCPCIQNHKYVHGTENTAGLSNGDQNNQANTPINFQNMRESRAHEDLVSKNERSTNKPPINACSISNTQEVVNQMYQAVDNVFLYDQDELSHAPLDQFSNASPKIKSTQLKYEISIMKEFINKYLEYKNSMNDPIGRETFFYLLKNELQKRGYKRTNKPSPPENLDEELKYMKLISEWLKKIPVDEAFNTSMNKDRIYFVKGLAQNIAQMDINKIREPYAIDYDMHLERTIKQYVLQLPLLPEQNDNIKTAIDQLLQAIKSQPQRKVYSGENSLQGICITEQNKMDLLDKHIRENGEQLQNDELVLDAWAHRLVEEVLQSVSERSSDVTHTWQVFNVSVGPYIPNHAHPTYRFRLELDYAKEIIEFLNSLSAPSSPIDVEKIYELTERLILRNKKMFENANHDSDDQDLVKLLERWIMDLPSNFDNKSNLINAIQTLAHSIKRVTKKYVDTIKTDKNSNSLYDTRIYTETTMMHCRKNMECQSSECKMAHLIENLSQCLPIDGSTKENIKAMRAHVAKTLFEKICELKADTKMYNDGSMYKQNFEDVINTQFDGLPVNSQKKCYIDYLKTILLNKLMLLKTKTPDKRIGFAYRIALEKALEEVVPSTASKNRDVSFEIYIHQLTNKFLLEHYDHSKHPAKIKYCRKIQRRINKHVLSAIHRTGRLFTPHETNNLFYNVLFKVPVPDHNSLKHQIEYIKTRCEIDDWFDTLPLKRTADPSEFDKWDHTLMSLAKTIVNFEQEPNSNIKLHKDILRHLAKFPLEREYEFQRSDIVYRLLTLLASTFEARQCVTLEDPKTKDSTSKTNAPEPCLSKSVILSADRDPAEIIVTIIGNWCTSLPLKGLTDNQNQTIKENLAKQLNEKIKHLNNSGVDNDRLYEKYLNEEIEKAIATLHLQTELHGSIQERKQALNMDIMYQRPLLKINALREEYKQELSKVIDDVLTKPKNLTPDNKFILEVIIDEIKDNFIEYHYNKDNDEIKINCKKRLVKSVFDYLEIVKHKEETIPLETQVIKANLLINEMSKIAEPNNLAMKEELQEVRMKHKLNELFDKFLPKADGMKLASWKKAKAALAKKLHEIEKTDYNTENVTKMKEEISKTMNAMGANISQENINEFIKNLVQHKITRKPPLEGTFYLHKTDNSVMYCTQEPRKTSTSCGPDMNSSSVGYSGWNPGSESQSKSSYFQSHNTVQDNISHVDQPEVCSMNLEKFYGRSRSFPRSSGQCRDNNCNRTPPSNESETSSIQDRNIACRENYNNLPPQNITNSVGNKGFTQTVEVQSKSGQRHESLAPAAYHQENIDRVQAYWSREAPDQSNNMPSTRQAEVCTHMLYAQQTSLVANSEKCCGHPQQKDQDISATYSENICPFSVKQQTDQITTRTIPAEACSCRQIPSPQSGAEGQQLPNHVPTQKGQNPPLVYGAQQLPSGAYFDHGVTQPVPFQNIDNRYNQFSVQKTQGVTGQSMPIAGQNVAPGVQQLPGAFAGAQSQYRSLHPQLYNGNGYGQIAPAPNEYSVQQTPKKWYRQNFSAPEAVIQATLGQTQAQSFALPPESARYGQATSQRSPQAHIPNPVFYQTPGALNAGLHKTVPGNAYSHGQVRQTPNGYKHSAPKIAAHLKPPSMSAPLPTQASHPPQYNNPKPQQPTKCYCPPNHQSNKSLHFNRHPVTVTSEDKACTQSLALQPRSDQSHSPYRQIRPEHEGSCRQNQPLLLLDLNHQRHPQSERGHDNFQAKMNPASQSQQCSTLKVLAYPTPNSSPAPSIHAQAHIQYNNYPQQSPERGSAIPSPQESRQMENGSYFGSPQLSLISTPETAISGLRKQNIAGQQNLYQTTQANSFYVQVNQSEHTQRIPDSVQTYNVKPEIVSTGCSNIESHLFQRAATSTTTISGNEKPKKDDATDCGSMIRDQSTQDQSLCNQVCPYGVQQSPMPYWQPCNPSEVRHGVKAIPVPVYNPYHLDTKAVCKQHSKCCAIPVLQYCDSVDDFLPTLLPMNWFKVRSRKKRQSAFYPDRI